MYIYTHTATHPGMYLYACIHKYIFTDLDLRMYIRTCTHTHTYRCVCVCVFMQTHQTGTDLNAKDGRGSVLASFVVADFSYQNIRALSSKTLNPKL